MKMSAQGLVALSKREGVRLKAYQDVKGIWTVGVGHTGPEVVEGLWITPTQCNAYLASDCKIAEDAVNRVTATLSQNQFDALVSFVFNVGVSAFLNSTMFKLLNQGKVAEAAQQFDRWVIPKEIYGRRMSEKQQFLA